MPRNRLRPASGRAREAWLSMSCSPNRPPTRPVMTCSPAGVLPRLQIELVSQSLAEPPDFAVHVASEGAAEPVATTIRLLDEARAAGAVLDLETNVTALVEVHGRVTGVRSGDTLLTADRVVLAAGTGSKGLAASIGINLPLEAPPGLLVYTEPAPPMLNAMSSVRRFISVIPPCDLSSGSTASPACASAMLVNKGTRPLCSGPSAELAVIKDMSIALASGEPGTTQSDVLTL